MKIEKIFWDLLWFLEILLRFKTLLLALLIQRYLQIFEKFYRSIEQWFNVKADRNARRRPLFQNIDLKKILNCRVIKISHFVKG